MRSRPASGPEAAAAPADHLPDWAAMLDEYSDYRGWTRDGIPIRTKLEALGLGAEGTRLGL